VQESCTRRERRPRCANPLVGAKLAWAAPVLAAVENAGIRWQAV